MAGGPRGRRRNAARAQKISAVRKTETTRNMHLQRGLGRRLQLEGLLALSLSPLCLLLSFSLVCKAYSTAQCPTCQRPCENSHLCSASVCANHVSFRNSGLVLVYHSAFFLDNALWTCRGACQVVIVREIAAVPTALSQKLYCENSLACGLLRLGWTLRTAPLQFTFRMCLPTEQKLPWVDL